MTLPLIGITTWRETSEAGHPWHAVAEAYVQALAQAGALPVLIPLGLSGEILTPMLARLDGVLFSGGGDIDPQVYGGEPRPELDEVDADRDRVEFQLLEFLVENETPFLGICRGFQVINVGLGGALYTDIAAEYARARKHDYYPGWPRDHLGHTVEVIPESRLGRIVGSPLLRVNSLHHQGVSRLAPGLLASAISPDGLIEGLELPEHPFGLAVQWHPECLTNQAPTRALFRAFVEAASRGNVGAAV